MHHLQRRWMNRVATEVTQEVAMLFEHDHLDAGAREQKSQHHAGRAASHDATSSTYLLQFGGGELRAHSEPPAVFIEARFFARAAARISRTLSRYSFNRASKPRCVGW